MGQVSLSGALHSSLTWLGLGLGVGLGLGLEWQAALLAHIDSTLQARGTVLGAYLEGTVRHRVPG